MRTRSYRESYRRTVRHREQLTPDYDPTFKRDWHNAGPGLFATDLRRPVSIKSRHVRASAPHRLSVTLYQGA